MPASSTMGSPGRGACLALAFTGALCVAAPALGQEAAAPAATPTAPDTTTGAPQGEGASEPAAPRLVSPALGSLAGADTPRRPPSGSDTGTVRVGAGVGLRGFGAPRAGQEELPAQDRPWTVRPSLGVDVQATNNVFQTRNDTRSDIITSITPGIALGVSTSRLLGSLFYEPTARFYATYSNQNRVEHVGAGQLLAAIVPGTFYVDIRGSASAVPTGGLIIPGSAQPIPRGDETQIYTFQVTPYLVHRFGSAATAQIGYSFQYSEQSGDRTFGSSASQPDFTAQDYTANRGFAVLRTGEDFGRLALQALVDGTVFNGTGVYDGAHRFVAGVEGRYAILPTVAVLLGVGYENLEYGGTAPGSVEGPTWSVGTRLTPDPDSIIILRYGRRDGFDSFSLNAGVALGVRTNLYAQYNERLSTSLEQAQDLLSTTALDPLGNPVDNETGAPVVFVNPFFSVQNALYRTRTATVSLRQTWPRDSIAVSATWQDRDPISAAPGTVATQQTGGYVTLSWAHDLAPRTTVIATVQYGRTTQDAATVPDEDVYSATATLVHRLTETLLGSLQIGWTRQESSAPSQGYTQATLRAALRKVF